MAVAKVAPSKADALTILTKRVFNHLSNENPTLGRLTVRFLWKGEGDIYRFRANWWNESNIVKSVFLRVSEDVAGGLCVNV